MKYIVNYYVTPKFTYFGLKFSSNSTKPSNYICSVLYVVLYRNQKQSKRVDTREHEWNHVCNHMNQTNPTVFLFV